jgi:hypothetical protein
MADDVIGDALHELADALEELTPRGMPDRPRREGGPGEIRPSATSAIAALVPTRASDSPGNGSGCPGRPGRPERPDPTGIRATPQS